MRPETFFVKYISVHNCFLHFSERWLEKFKDTSNVLQVLKLEYGMKKCGYFSCSPELRSSRSNSNDDDDDNNNIVGISATYAQKLGLKDKEKVTVSVCSSVCSVNRINVSVVTADDWEILEMNSNLVQSSLLDQVRVVWCNQILVIWVSRSVYLSLRVDGFESDCIAGLLEPLSDVVVTPPGVSALVTESSVEHASLKRDLLQQTSQKCGSQIEDFSTGQSVMSVLWDTLRSYVSGRGSKKEDMLLVEGPLRTEAKCQTITVLQKCSHRPLPAVYRVHPLCLPPSENERKTDDYLLIHPYNVFVRRCCMPSVNAVFLNHRKGVLTCKLIRIPDPTDSEGLHSKHVSKSDELHRQENAAVPTAKASSVSVHVQLYVIEDIYDSLSDSFKEYLDKVTLNKRIGHGSLLMSSVARLVLDVRIGARLNLEVVTSASGCLVSEIQITPLGNLEKSAKELETLFRCYVAEQVRTHGLLINSESFLTLQASAGSTTHVHVSLLPSDMEYAILDPDSVRKCKFTVKDNTSHLVYPSFNKELATSDKCSVRFGYFKELLLEGITTLELSLHLTSLVEIPLSLRANFISDNILILGTAGSGKSTLARTMCRELEKPPHFVHWVEVQCKPLKGKKVETLHKLVSQFLRECVYYQPAVLMFDDLEAIAGIGGSAPGQPESEDSYYYTRVGERLSELLEEFQSSNCISVIATAPSRLKVNSSLVAPRGRHMFKTVLEIPELNKGDRLDILKSIVCQRSYATVGGAIPLNWSKIAGKTEGYVMQDLVDLTDKAVFQACKKAVSAQEHTEALSLELDTSVFEEALNNSVPLLQRGVEFFHSSSYSWDDIGGLSDVKKTLIEVLQWPSQYPEIFENAPLRVQSGLLLYGAPGTGKTLLAGAVAKECGLKFISIKGPELLSKYIGASEEAVRNTFQKAQSAKPCILFFDEFDSLAPRRGHDNTGVTDRVVNQLLTQLDGVESLHGVSVVAATSRPDLIDPALLRPGRLDRIVKCPLPDRDDRLSILRALGRKLVLSDDVNFGEIANETEGFTGADLQAVLYTALLLTVEQNALCEVGGDKDVKQEPVAGDSMVKSEMVISGPVVTQANLKAALKDTKPSLSDTEKRRYRLIYEKFERSRGGTSAEEMAAMPQRATLA